MAFDKKLDVSKFSETKDFEMSRITVAIFSYNNGTPKLQISREDRNGNTGEWVFSKLGRMTKEEITAVLPLIEKAVKHF